MTITKTSNRAKKAIATAKNIRCYSLSNGFKGEPLTDTPMVWGGEIVNNQYTSLVPVSQAEFLTSELNNSRHAKLTAGENGNYCLHVHSNLWFEFTSEVL